MQANCADTEKQYEYALSGSQAAGTDRTDGVAERVRALALQRRGQKHRVEVPATVVVAVGAHAESVVHLEESLGERSGLRENKEGSGMR